LKGSDPKWDQSPLRTGGGQGLSSSKQAMGYNKSGNVERKM